MAEQFLVDHYDDIFEVAALAGLAFAADSQVEDYSDTTIFDELGQVAVTV